MSSGARERSPKPGARLFPLQGHGDGPHCPTLSRVPVKSFEVLLYSLHVWDFPWPLTGPPISSRRAAPPQLPQPLACLAQECKGGRETEGRGSRLRKLCYVCPGLCLPFPTSTPLPSPWSLRRRIWTLSLPASLSSHLRSLQISICSAFLGETFLPSPAPGQSSCCSLLLTLCPHPEEKLKACTVNLLPNL